MGWRNHVRRGIRQVSLIRAGVTLDTFDACNYRSVGLEERLQVIATAHGVGHRSRIEQLFFQLLAYPCRVPPEINYRPHHGALALQGVEDTHDLPVAPSGVEFERVFHGGTAAGLARRGGEGPEPPASGPIRSADRLTVLRWEGLPPRLAWA